MRAVLVLLLASQALAEGEDDIPPPSRWAVLVGIDKYEHMPPLKFCGRDMIALQKVLVAHCGYRRDQIRLLVQTGGDAPPLKGAIEFALDDFLSKARKRDTVFFAFSGHGIHDKNRSYLMLAENKPTDRARPLRLSRVQELLADCPAQQGLLVIDACRTGGFDPGAVPPGKGFLQLFSCETNEKSYEEPALEHGLFSYFLLQGLTDLKADTSFAGNKDERVTGAELFAFVSQEVRRYSIRKKRRQTPRMRLDASLPLVLAYAKGGKLGPEKTNEAMKMALQAEGPTLVHPEFEAVAGKVLELPREFGPARDVQTLVAAVLDKKLSVPEFLEKYRKEYRGQAIRILSYRMARASFQKRELHFLGLSPEAADSTELIQHAVRARKAAKRGADSAVLLAGKQATRAEFLAAMKAQADRTKPGEVLFVVFDGGGTDTAWRTADGEIALVEVFRLADACRGHVVIVSQPGKPEWAPYRFKPGLRRAKLARIFIQGDGPALAEVLFKGMEGTADRDAALLFRAIFRRLLVKGNGEDGYVTLRELVTYCQGKGLSVFGHIGRGDIVLTPSVLVVD